MATDVIGTITNVINSPPGQLAAGAALGGIVWKFFERVEAVLTDQTKFEIAVSLVGINAGEKMEPLARTFINIHDRLRFVPLSKTRPSNVNSGRGLDILGVKRSDGCDFPCSINS